MSREKESTAGKYDDIIGLPHHQSGNHPHMTLQDRAAQFSPFQALTGYEAAIEETARLTDMREELDEERLLYLDQAVLLLEEQLKKGRVPLSVTYFVPDERKEGGSFRSCSGRLRRIDRTAGILIFEDGTRIRTEDITAMEGDALRQLRGPEETA